MYKILINHTLGTRNLHILLAKKKKFFQHKLTLNMKSFHSQQHIIFNMLWNKWVYMEIESIVENGGLFLASVGFLARWAFCSLHDSIWKEKNANTEDDDKKWKSGKNIHFNNNL